MTGTPRTLALILATGGLSLAACGQSGPLYLPGNPSQVQVEKPATETGDVSDGMEEDEAADARD